MEGRKTCNNLKIVSDDDNEDESNDDKNENDDQNDDEGNERNYDRRNDQNDDKGDDRNDNKDDDKDDYVNEVSYAEEEKEEEEEDEENKKSKQKEMNEKIIFNVARNKRKRYQTQPKPESTASAMMMMRYLLNEKTTNRKTQITLPTQQPNEIDVHFKFFSSISATVKSFSPYYQNIAKCQIFSIVSELEMKQIVQKQEPLCMTNVSTEFQRPVQMQSYHAGQYNVSCLLPSSSPLASPLASPLLSSTVPNSSSSSSSTIHQNHSSSLYYDFLATIPMPHINE